MIASALAAAVLFTFSPPSPAAQETPPAAPPDAPAAEAPPAPSDTSAPAAEAPAASPAFPAPVAEPAPAAPAAPAAAAAPVAAGASASVVEPRKELVGYEDGFFIAAPDGNSKLRVRGLVQPRFAVVMPGAVLGPEGGLDDANASFAVQRAQLELLGYALTKNITFDLKVEFGRGAAFMKDAYIEGKLLDGVFMRGGLYKRPFQRQQMASDWKLAFFERNLTEEAFKGGRDIGLSMHNGLDRGPTVEWSLGVYSGASDKPSVTGDVIVDAENGVGVLEGVAISNVPRLMSPTLVGRVGYNSSPDLKPYSEVDFEGGGFRFGASLSAFEGFDWVKSTSLTRLCVDGIAKLEHVTATGALVVSLAQDSPGAFTQSPDGVGAFLQAGWLLFDKVQPALRYSVVDKIADGAGELEHEIVGNITVLLAGQNVLWGIEGGSNIVEGAPDLRFRSQAQIAF